jgi:hypothetical protein
MNANAPSLFFRSVIYVNLGGQGRLQPLPQPVLERVEVDEHRIRSREGFTSFKE